MAKIDVRNVYKVFGPRPQTVMEQVRQGMSKDEVLEKTGHTVGLSDVSLSIAQGEIFVVMGLSGSGKSTLIRHLNRLIEPTEGQILLDGEDVLAMGSKELSDLRRHKMSMVFQRFGLLPHRTVLQNVAYGLNVQGVSKEEQQQKGRHWIDLVGLGGYEDAYPDQLSGGMQQRVGLARALCTDPEVLLMDEAFSALDPLIRRDMQDQLIELQQRLHKTIVFITHDLDEALRLGDKIAILNDGKVVQVGTAEEILLHPADDYVEAFVKDVNRVRVITAQTVMTDPSLVLKQADKPEAWRKELESSEHDYAYVVDQENQLQGVVTEAGLEEHGNGTDKAVQEVQAVESSTVLEEVLPLTLQAEWPLPVINEAGQIVGVIPRRRLIAAIADAEPAAEGEPEVPQS